MADQGHRTAQNTGHSYLVGGGIASLAAAAFMIRDGDIPGDTITIIEELGTVGGSLDAAGSAHDGYMMRGSRTLESKYVCTYGLFSSIPALDRNGTVTEEIVRWNETLKTSLKVTSRPRRQGPNRPTLRPQRAAYPDHRALDHRAGSAARRKKH